VIDWSITAGDARTVLAGWPAGAVQCVCTSPPYLNLRDYGVAGQIGMESSIAEYVAALVDVFRAVRRVLRPDGTCWINLGDSYSNAGRAGSRGTKRGAGKPGWTDGGALGDKQLLLIPARVALALQADGWYLRSAIVWNKPNAMPESVKDRPTKSYEMVYLFSKQGRYYYDAEAIAEPPSPTSHGSRKIFRGGGAYTGGNSYNNHAVKPNLVPGNGPADEVTSRNARDVWTIATEAFPDAHFATFPTELARRCILAGSRPGDVVADPFTGAGTVGVVALRHGRAFWGAELNPSYVEMASDRIVGDSPLFNRPAAEGAA
jgi:DNA modification methylase